MEGVISVENRGPLKMSVAREEAGRSRHEKSRMAAKPVIEPQPRVRGCAIKAADGATHNLPNRRFKTTNTTLTINLHESLRVNGNQRRQMLTAFFSTYSSALDFVGRRSM
jgi:hypothetical protein